MTEPDPDTGRHPGGSAIVLFAHGSRDPHWHRPVHAVAQRLALRAPDQVVRAAYLELTQPDLPTVVESLVSQGVLTIRVVPLFLGVGRHAREDLPRLAAELRQRFAGLHLTVDPAVGEREELLDLLANLAAG